MVHTSQRGQALIEVIATVLVLMSFAFLYFNFTQKTQGLLEESRFKGRIKAARFK